jgi:uncharacterized protein YuzE
MTISPLPKFACYDRSADIAWIRTGESHDAFSERVRDGRRYYDRRTYNLVAIEVWDASTRLPGALLGILPPPDGDTPA